MAKTPNRDAYFELADGYNITRLNSLKCRLIFRNSQGKVLAIMPGCQSKISAVNLKSGRQLSKREKSILQNFIKEQGIALGTDAAVVLEMSILRFANGEEQYLTEAELKSLLHNPIDAEYLYVGCLKADSITIAAYSRGGIYNFGRLQVRKIIVEENCDLQIDLRDNEAIRTIQIGNSYNGGLNLSRSNVENITIGNNCRCDLAVFDSRKCFNLRIGDVYSGDLNIKNSCFHNLRIGYYSYASIRLQNNWGRRNIQVGDSFRGNLDIDSLNISGIIIGNDCKGVIKIGGTDAQNGSRGVVIGDEFGGVLDLQGNNSLRELKVGRHAVGKFYLWGKGGVQQAVFGPHFNGVADFSESSVEYINFDGGSSGEVILRNCYELKLMKIHQYQNLQLQIWQNPLQIRYDEEAAYYYFADDISKYDSCLPLYRQFYQQLKNTFSEHFN